MTRIRVNPENLIQKSADLTVVAVGLRGLSDDVKQAAESAPSYDGQFAPLVGVIGWTASIGGKKRAESIADHSCDLVKRASAFIAADQAGVLGIQKSGLSSFLNDLKDYVFGVGGSILTSLVKLGSLLTSSGKTNFQPGSILPDGTIYNPKNITGIDDSNPLSKMELIGVVDSGAVSTNNLGIPVTSPFSGSYKKTGDYGIYMENPIDYPKYANVGGALHNGIDVKPLGGDNNVHPIGPGKVVKVGKNAVGNSYGNYVQVEHHLNDGRVVIVTYAHLSSTSSDLVVGKEISSTDAIGVMGGTGKGNEHQYPDHLHMDMYEKGKGPNWEYHKQVNTKNSNEIATIKPSDKMPNGQTYEESMRENWVNIEDILNGKTDVKFLEIEDWEK